MQLTALTAVSPIDGRYQALTEQLQPIFSEYGLIKSRIQVEIAWLIALSNEAAITEVPTLNDDALKILHNIRKSFSPSDAERVKEIENTTRHDVKAVEYFIKQKMAEHPALDAIKEYVHFACTSEDINNLSYALMVKEGLVIFLHEVDKIIKMLEQRQNAWADTPMMSRTHGQAATPTTVSKEISNVLARLKRATQQISAIEIRGKINGAVGNFNAHVVAYPNVDWPGIAERFVNELGIDYNPLTTQIEPHDWVAELMDAISRLNTIFIDFSRDVWGYISLHYFIQKTVDGEVGSSTMPHKVNPIDFENAEGNLGLANALARHLSEKLPISRWQRDLSDSTVQRNIGSVFAYSLIAFASLQRGIDKLEVNKTLIKRELDEHWELLGEALQTVMRRYGIEQPYEKLKALTRGKTLTAESYAAFVNEQALPDEVKKDLLNLTPSSYVGLAEKL